MFYQPLNTKITLPEPLPCAKTEIHDLLIEVTVFKEDGSVKSSRSVSVKDLFQDQ